MAHLNADRMLSDAEIETVSGGSSFLDKLLRQFAEANAGSDDAATALATLGASIKANPGGRHR